MINSKNKNYSFIAISKHSKSKKNQINATLYNIFTPNRSNHPLKKSLEKLHLSYVSPNSQELSNFKSNLYKYLHQNTLQHNNYKNDLSKGKPRAQERSFDIDVSSATHLAKHYYKITNKSFYEGIQKRKNIRQYMCQMSQDKRKRYGNKIQNKTEQLNTHVVQQEVPKINPMLIIRKVNNRQKEGRDQNREKDIFKDRDVPIHHTQIYYFSKKSVKTEPGDSYEAEKYAQEKYPVTMSRIFELREQLAERYEHNMTNVGDNELSLINQVHPTVAIITTQPENQINNQDREFHSQKKGKDEGNSRGQQKIRKKDEEEISPWNRRQQAQYEYE